MMNMMADSENRRRERNQAIRSADELLFSTLSALFPERASAIATFDITRQRSWLLARIGSGGMEGVAMMFMGGGTDEGWKVDLRELVTGNSWTPKIQRRSRMLSKPGSKSFWNRSKNWPTTANRA